MKKATNYDRFVEQVIKLDPCQQFRDSLTYQQPHLLMWDVVTLVWRFRAPPKSVERKEMILPRWMEMYCSSRRAPRKYPIYVRGEKNN